MRKLKQKFGFCGKNVEVRSYNICKPGNLFLYDNTNIFSGFTFVSEDGHFIMKSGSGSAQGLTVVTDNHARETGKLLKDPELFYGRKGTVARDVIVEEDVWIGANVTLLPGAKIGRGCNIGAGSVIRSSVPPYAIVLGNPAKVVGFVFTPEEVLEHEKKLYKEEDRLSKELLEKNYNKFFVNRMKEIKDWTKL
ncbi:DapH/DapD/GlmU-related protein [Fibrobacter sp. UWB12]|uniref:acyltransferase n=1 Tax=Fibrobacter sp. UWB12 TaxID=1896203 RepID=UPI001587A36E|nr:DapH/DapD/GlmU-related protein [Fibrobacter sp. UWB12]